MKISVIIPVYNAQEFLTESVKSAVSLDVVNEIILIEDGSNDDSLLLAKELEQEFKKVILIQHPDKGNHGTASARNLGVEKATNDWVAFLDADDYFLPNRFDKDIKVIKENKNIDGVYSAVGTTYLDENSKSIFVDKMNLEAADELTTITSNVNPKDLFLYLIEGKGGYFCTDGILLKKELIQKAGGFDVTLRLHQDTDLWLKMAFLGKLMEGEIESAVSMRTIHPNNRITNKNTASQILFWDVVFNWFKNKSLSKQENMSLLIQYAFAYKGKYKIDYSKIRKLFIFKINFIVILFKNPIMFKVIFFPLLFLRTFKRLLK